MTEAANPGGDPIVEELVHLANQYGRPSDEVTEAANAALGGVEVFPAGSPQPAEAARIMAEGTDWDPERFGAKLRERIAALKPTKAQLSRVARVLDSMGILRVIETSNPDHREDIGQVRAAFHELFPDHASLFSLKLMSLAGGIFGSSQVDPDQAIEEAQAIAREGELSADEIKRMVLRYGIRHLVQSAEPPAEGNNLEAKFQRTSNSIRKLAAAFNLTEEDLQPIITTEIVRAHALSQWKAAALTKEFPRFALPDAERFELTLMQLTATEGNPSDGEYLIQEALKIQNAVPSENRHAVVLRVMEAYIDSLENAGENERRLVIDNINRLGNAFEIPKEESDALLDRKNSPYIKRV